MKKLNQILTWIAAGILPLLALVVLYNVIARALLNKAPSWPFEVSIFLFGIMCLLAGGQVLRDNEHVAVDIVPRMVPPRTRQVLFIISMALIIVVCVVVIINGSQVAYDATVIRERSIFQTTFNPEIWWFRWMIPLGALLIGIEALRLLIRARNIDAVPNFEDPILADSEISNIPDMSGNDVALDKQGEQQ